MRSLSRKLITTPVRKDAGAMQRVASGRLDLGLRLASGVPLTATHCSARRSP